MLYPPSVSYITAAAGLCHALPGQQQLPHSIHSESDNISDSTMPCSKKELDDEEFRTLVGFFAFWKGRTLDEHLTFINGSDEGKG
ncbi:unnamed protein product [Gongylonema pulchrum]|uniref:Uncharacterized protein n=1 Tax=Gongylonema pulchrum TaxID=637853 RepID=A0A183DMN8_9BILA|nr:unnamed protein product [Gongylonema pulchrum]